MGEKNNIAARTVVHTMTTQVELKAKSEEELLLALQVLCSSLPEGKVTLVVRISLYEQILSWRLRIWVKECWIYATNLWLW